MRLCVVLLFLSIFIFQVFSIRYEKTEGDILRVVYEDSDPKFMSSALTPDKRWPNGIVYYHINSPQFRPKEVQAIKGAMQEIMSKTCVKFHERNHGNHIHIVRGQPGECNSLVGRHAISGQELRLGSGFCFDRQTILHELMHSMGFIHEHSNTIYLLLHTLPHSPFHPNEHFLLDRADRDDHIEILTENIDPLVSKHNYDKRNYKDLSLMDTPYSYVSIMHYGETAGSKHYSLPVIKAKRSFNGKMGGGNELSPIDVLRINKYYGCKTNTSTTAAPGNEVQWKKLSIGDSYVFYWQSGCDFLETNVQVLKLDAPTCAVQCRQHLACTHWSWNNSNGGTCTFKKGTPSTNTQTPICKEGGGQLCGYSWTTAQGGSYACSSTTWKQLVSTDGKSVEAFYHIGCDFTGQDTHTVMNVDATQCARGCRSHPTCTHFTWLNTNNGSLCRYKRGHSPASTPLCSEGMVCGYWYSNAIRGEYQCRKAETLPKNSVTTANTWKVLNALDGSHVDAFYQYGCEFRDENTAIIAGEGPAQCARGCRHSDNCTNFVWRPDDGGTCLYKKRHVEGNIPHCHKNSQMVCGYWFENAVQGPYQCQNENPTWKQLLSTDGRSVEAFYQFGCDFTGYDVHSIKNIDATQCARGCRSHQTCTHFTWWNRTEGSYCNYKGGPATATPICNDGMVCGYWYSNAVGGDYQCRRGEYLPKNSVSTP